MSLYLQNIPVHMNSQLSAIRDMTGKVSEMDFKSCQIHINYWHSVTLISGFMWLCFKCRPLLNVSQVLKLLLCHDFALNICFKATVQNCNAIVGNSVVLNFLLSSPYWLKSLKESKHLKFLFIFVMSYVEIMNSHLDRRISCMPRVFQLCNLGNTECCTDCTSLRHIFCAVFQLNVEASRVITPQGANFVFLVYCMLRNNFDLWYLAWRVCARYVHIIICC